MSYFEKIYQRVFGKPTSQKTPILHELIKRDHKFNFYFAEWKGSQHQKDIISQISHSYHRKLIKQDSSLQVHILESSASNGLAISYSEDIGRTEFEYIFEYFRDQVLDHLDYRLEISDRIITEKDDYIESRQKHYLKPIRPTSAGIIPQLYGNILIEHVEINNTPSYLKIQANTYSDHLFEKPYKFEGLISTLFQSNT